MVLAKVMRSREYILLLAVILIGLAVRLYEINYSFSGDEYASLSIAHQHLFHVLSGSLLDRTHPPLYNILLHLWMMLTGTSEISTRILSVLFWLASTILSYALLRRFVDCWIALGLLVILALSPHFVYHGQEARPYALIELITIVNLLTFMRLLDKRDKIRIAMWTLSCVLLPYTQHIGILLVCTELLLAIVMFGPDRVRVAFYGSIALVLYIPWFVVQLGYPFLTGKNVLHGIDWMQRVHWDSAVWFYSISIAGDLTTHLLWFVLACFVLLGMAYVIHFALNKTIPPNDHIILLCVAFAIPAIVFLISKYVHPVFVWRQLIGSAVAFVCVIGLCLAILPRKLAAVILLIFVALAAESLPQGLPYNRNPPWRNMAKEIDQRYGPITVASHEGWGVMILRHYRKMGRVLYIEPALKTYTNNDQFLIVCRQNGNGACSEISENVNLKARTSLVKVWRGHFPYYFEFKLYKVKEGR